MRNNRTFTIVFFGILAVAILLFIYYNYANRKFNWNENYRSESDQPYGTEFLKDILESHTTGTFTYNTKKRLADALDVEKDQQTYVFIGNFMFLDSGSLHTLTEFIKNGNDAFIATPYPQEILYRLWTSECVDSVSFPNTRNNIVNANFYHPDLAVTNPYTFNYRFENEDLPYDWNYVTSTAFCDSIKSATPLGFIDPYYVNFFKVRHGKGNLFVHTNPIVFTNYFLTKEKNMTYISSVFSHLSNKDLIWDEYSKTPSYNFDNGSGIGKSPLYFVMQQPSLRYGWWLLLITAILYIIFAAKRKQKVIPVLEPKTNTSLQFIKMISMLHYQHEDNNDMARKKMKHFLHYVRTKYGLSTHKMDDVFVKRLSLKSNVSEEEINNIFAHYQVIERFKNITISRLVEFYQHIDNFYKKGK